VYNGTTGASVTYSDNRIDSDALSVSGTAAFGDKNVGTGKTVSVSGIALSGADAGNYNLQNTTASTVSNITPANLTYTANPANRIYGESNPIFNGTVTGFVNGETLGTATIGSLSFSGLANASSPVGTYAIYGSGLTANNGNYTFVQAPSNSNALTVGAITVVTPPSVLQYVSSDFGGYGRAHSFRLGNIEGSRGDGGPLYIIEGSGINI
ncbi:MBG domain-containing protein, partial [Sporomusa malonica]